MLTTLLWEQYAINNSENLSPTTVIANSSYTKYWPVCMLQSCLQNTHFPYIYIFQLPVLTKIYNSILRVHLILKLAEKAFEQAYVCMYVCSNLCHNDYCHRKWTPWPEFKSGMRLFEFCIALKPMENVWIKLFSMRLWVNSRANWAL